MDIQERLVQIELDSGETVFVRPLSPFALQAIEETARSAFPTPDKTPFERPLTDVAPNAMPGVMIPAEENPEYQSALKLNKADVNGRMIELTILSGVIVDVSDGREAALERYAGRLARLRKVIPTMPDDDWLAVSMYCLLATFKDRGRVANAAINPLTDKEVRFALRSFRCEIQPGRPAGHSGSEITPIHASADRQAQPAAD